MAKESVWARFKKSFRNLLDEMEKDSVSASGSSPMACCHVDPEELEQRREAYRAEAEARKKPANA